MKTADLLIVINSKYFLPEEKAYAQAELQRRKAKASVHKEKIGEKE